MFEKEYKQYKFKIEYPTNKQILEAYQTIKVYNKKVDNDILLLSLHGGGNFSLYLQDRFFCFTIDDETKRISSFDGELTNNKIEIVKLQLPMNISKAIIMLDTTDKLYSGSGSYVKFKTNIIEYDKEQKILQIGDIKLDEVTFKFFNNAYAQINEGKLSGLMFTGIDI